jgi:hypothetical protein
MFWDSLLLPSSRFKQSKQVAGSIWLHSCIGNCVGSYWFSGKVKQANWINGA